MANLNSKVVLLWYKTPHTVLVSSIPVPIIAYTAKTLENYYTHTELENLKDLLDIPGPPLIGNKVDKLRGLLILVNKDTNPKRSPLETLGKVLEEFMEVDKYFQPSEAQIEARKLMQNKLAEYGLEYFKGGLIIQLGGEVPVIPSPTSSSVPFGPPTPATKPPEFNTIPFSHQDFFAPKPQPEPQTSSIKQKHTIFIGHGHSAVWRELKDFLVERLGQNYEEFNREPAPGMGTQERLEAMLKNADFAFLVMTAEDTRGDGKFYARDNVIHEVGLFQGRLGFKKAIILLEEGCEEFSNIDGLTYVPFAKGRIGHAYEEVRRVLEREGIIKG